jgi:hypothetical protein
MAMKAKLIGLLLVLPLMAADPAGYKYWSAADLKAMGKTMAPKVNAQKVALENLGDFGPARALMVHREGSGEAELHETEADVDFRGVRGGDTTDRRDHAGFEEYGAGRGSRAGCGGRVEAEDGGGRRVARPAKVAASGDAGARDADHILSC